MNDLNLSGLSLLSRENHARFADVAAFLVLVAVMNHELDAILMSARQA